MPYTIEIKLLPATNCKPTRIKAQWGLVSHVMGYDYSLNLRHNMLKCALQLRKKYSPFLRFAGLGVNHKGIWTIVTR